jgi:gamma-glutamyltranspeptidase/glutathione hydrolase
MKNDRYVRLHDELFNPRLRDFFWDLVKGQCDIYSGTTAEKLAGEMNRNNGMVTMEDLRTYEVAEREPLRIKYREREILTNPPPATGGVMLALALHLLEKINLSNLSRESEKFLIALIELMKEMSVFSPQKISKLIMYPSIDLMTAPLVDTFMKNIADKIPVSSRGTTHISVIDEEGNAVSMTTSNGSGSGCFIPDTGIMLNNMMGEDDLHPGGFHSSPPNRRVSSMMLPTIIMKGGNLSTGACY